MSSIADEGVLMYVEESRRSLDEEMHDFDKLKWGRSSAGRAPALQAGGQEFDSPRLHHLYCTLKTS